MPENENAGNERGDPLTLYPRLCCMNCQEYVYVTWPRGHAEREFQFECECKKLSLASLEHGAGWRSEQPDDWVRAKFIENEQGEAERSLHTERDREARDA